MELRPALLNSELTRDNIAPGYQETSEIRATLAAIDGIGRLYDALRSAREAASPHETPEARAMRYEKQYSEAVTKAKELALRGLAALEALERSTRAAALEQSGLSKAPKNDAEIRAALRGMPQAERDTKLSRAFETGDVEVLASIYNQNSITWGGSKGPLDTQFELFIDQRAPQAVAARKAGEKAFEGLNFAGEAFADAAKKWREPALAERGEKQEREFKEADAELRAALAG